MTIIRGPQPSENFQILPNATARDKRLSFRARGLLVLMLSYPPEWQFNREWLVRQTDGEGVSAVRTALRSDPPAHPTPPPGGPDDHDQDPAEAPQDRDRRQADLRPRAAPRDGVAAAHAGQRSRGGPMSDTKSSAERRFYNMLTIVFALPVVAVVLFWSALWVMLGLGAAHDQWPVVPALGYWATYLILAGLGSVKAVVFWSPSSTKDDR